MYEVFVEVDGETIETWTAGGKVPRNVVVEDACKQFRGIGQVRIDINRNDRHFATIKTDLYGNPIIEMDDADDPSVFACYQLNGLGKLMLIPGLAIDGTFISPVDCDDQPRRTKMNHVPHAPPIKRNEGPCNFVVTWYVPGYIPEMDPAFFSEFDDAKRYLLNELGVVEDDAASYDEDFAEEVSGIRQDLNLESKPFSAVVGSYVYSVEEVP
jgi:hypothetical protein